MAANGYVFSGRQVEDYVELRRAVRAIAARLGLDDLAIAGEPLGSVNWQHVQLTDDEAEDGNYPGVIVLPVDGEWEEIDGEAIACLVRPATEGQELEVGKTYLGRMSHYDDDGTGVFLVADGPCCGDDFTWLTKAENYNPAAGEAVLFDVTGGNRTTALPAGAAVNDRVILSPMYTSGSNRVILSGNLADSSAYYLNGALATGNNLGTNYASNEGNYLFRYVGTITVGETDYPHWTCDRPLSFPSA